MLKAKPEHFFGILPNRTFHDKQTNKKIHSYLLIMSLMIFLLKSVQLETLTDFTRAIYGISYQEEHSSSICLHLHSAFMEIDIYAFTASYFDCSPMCIIYSSCNVSYFRGHYFQISHFFQISSESWNSFTTYICSILPTY